MKRMNLNLKIKGNLNIFNNKINFLIVIEIMESIKHLEEDLKFFKKFLKILLFK